MNMIGGISSEYNSMVWKNQMKASAVDLIKKSYVNGNTGEVTFKPLSKSCGLGSIFAGK